jgi:hypothetical protein
MRARRLATWCTTVVLLGTLGCSAPAGTTDSGTPEDGGLSTIDPTRTSDGGLCNRSPVRETCWTDPATQFTWEIALQPPACPHAEAIADCSALVACGHDDWRLPTRDELITLLRGCPETMPGGACSTSLATGTYPSSCGCTQFQGPGPDGCYWDERFGGRDQCAKLARSYWSSTEVFAGSNSAYGVAFYTGWILQNFRNEGHFVRCVR